MTSLLTLKDGIYDPRRRFAFTNITAEPFTFSWGGVPTTVKPHQTIEVAHHIAVLATTKLCDQIMLGDIKRDEETYKAAHPNEPYFRSPRSGSIGVPMARKPIEDKILRELKVDEESPEVSMMRAQMKEQLMADLNAEKTAPVESIKIDPAEFSEVKGK